MPRLSLALLGSFQVALEGQPVTSFKSDKVRALLAYLAVEADRPHRRERLAGLLWPDILDQSARSNLRDVLANLRQAIGDRDAAPPFLLITRETVQFNRDSDCWLDVAAFQDLAADPGRNLEEAVALYRGEFLAGFSVADSPAFEEWILVIREQLARLMSSALQRLAELCEGQGDYQPAADWAWRQLEREPWDERSHQALMRALALGGQRGAALAQYNTCRRLLAEELGVEPAQETTDLYEQIRDGKLVGAPAPAPRLPAAQTERPEPPAFLDQPPAEAERSVFVARERELTQLEAALDQALAGHGRVVFVTGEAGSGKTALIHEFACRAQEAHANLVVASGNCNAYTGVGDPYLPFREILQLLTGDVQARWAAGAMTREHAHRLWNLLPRTARAVAEAGPDLIDTFVPRAAMRERAAVATHWPDRDEWLRFLAESAERRPTAPGMPSPQQSDLFEQYARVLAVLSRHVCLVLVLDDLQWADLGSISLLFHLGRQLAGSRILIIGAFRPEQVALGRDGAGSGSGHESRHPLEPLVNEFRRRYGEITLDLAQAESRDFVEALLDSEPNRLGVAFREMLFSQTHGHPLFTVELLRGLEERGDLEQDQEGYWVEGPSRNWDKLPARVEAVIAERIGRLDEPLRALLQVASVEGEVFTAEVVGQLQAADGRETVRRLSDELDRRHRLVRAQAIERLGSQRVSRYRFRNYLFQRYLYDSLDTVERAYLHEDVGHALEQLHRDQADEIAVQLAWHFQEAGITDKAARYLHLAGTRAVQLSAYDEARAHLARGLDLLSALPETRERAERELAMQISLGMAWMGDIPGPEWKSAVTRARDLCRLTGRSSELCRVLGELVIYHYVRAEYRPAREIGLEALSLAEQAGDPLLIAVSHWCLGFILFGLGEYATARTHLEQTISFYEPRRHHHPFVLLRGSDAGTSALAFDACCLWCLGFPDQALRRSQQALTLARELGHAFSAADVLAHGGCLFHALRRDWRTLGELAEELVQLSRQMRFSSFGGTGLCYLGGALTGLGQIEEGVAQIREGLATRQSIGALLYSPGILGSLAEAQARTGQLQDGLVTLAEALALVEEGDERLWEPELYRLRGELLQAQGDYIETDASLRQAVQIARRQQAKSWELRAATSLARLWQEQGRAAEAAELLAPVYRWFTEGLDTPDLTEARALLARLV